MTLAFQDETFDVAKGIGSGGTSDHSELTNLDYANSGHTGFLSDATFIEPNTTITVDPNGAGDYTTIQSAFDSLNGKWSSGTVKILIKNGTYTPASGQTSFNLNAQYSSIPQIIIEGESRDGTIITPKLYIGGTTATPVLVRKLSVVCNGASFSAALEINKTMATVSNVYVKNAWAGIYPQNQCILSATDISAEDMTGAAIFANSNGGVTVGGTLTCKNCATACSVGWGSKIVIYNVTKAFTNVTNATNQAIATVTSEGVILGGFAN